MLSSKWHNEPKVKWRPNTQSFIHSYIHNFELIGLSSFKFVANRNEIVQFAGLLFLLLFLSYLVERSVTQQQQWQKAFTNRCTNTNANGQKLHAKHSMLHDTLCVFACICLCLAFQFERIYQIFLPPSLHNSLCERMNGTHFVSVKLNSIQSWWAVLTMPLLSNVDSEWIQLRAESSFGLAFKYCAMV